MNWKVFITAFASAGLLALPQNSFTCGPSEDPYDYYTSFFHNKAGTSTVDKPFYYTALLTFYDEWNEDSTGYAGNELVQEWKEFFNASEQDIVQLIYQSTLADLAGLKESSTKAKALPAKFNNNAAAKMIVKEKDANLVNYLLFTKRTEPFYVSTDEWTEKKHDSLALNKFINEASTEFAKATDDFLKNKWAFQKLKLAFYNNRYADCIRWYNEHFSSGNTAAVAAPALSYNAGSLFRIGRKKESAYAFSKAFTLSDQNKRNNFLGFLWSTDNCNQELIADYTSLCKTNSERAAMISMFGMYGTDYRLDNLQKVYELDASSPLLPLLVTREINKLEEQYFTPLLANEKGGKALYVSWDAYREDENDKKKIDDKAEVIKTAQALEKLMGDKNLPNRSLYGAGAAYLHFMNRNYSEAKNILAKTKELPQNGKVKDQLQLINLLIAANEGSSISKEREAQLLPAMKWLVQKAKDDNDYQVFCRNFFSEILAQKYEQQNDAARAALSYGMADLAFLQKSGEMEYYHYLPATEFIRNEMSTENLVKLYEVMTSPATETEKFFIQNASIKRDGVIDVLGTSHLRDRNYTKAIEWLGKAGKLEALKETQYNYQTGKETAINIDPFYDYLNDWQRYSKSAPTPYTKLTLAKKLQDTKTKIDAATSGDNSKLFYEYASALYNMSHYGNSWSAVAYYRSSVDWNDGNYKIAWEKEYFGVYEARSYYQKAYEAATNKEFKAACLFMVAKCAQKQIPLPPYDYKNYEQYEKSLATFNQKFMNNPLFSKFKSEFGSTKFYQYAYNRCSYLRDYVKKNSLPSKAPASSGKPKTKG